MARSSTFAKAMLDGDLQKVRDELGRGEDPNQPVDEKRSRREPNCDIMPDGFTALHVAAYEDDTALARLLLEFHADLHSRTRYGSTPLELAAEWNSPGVVRVLLEAGANPELTTRSRGPLALAAGKGNREVVFLLLRAGARRGLDAALGVSCCHKGDPEILTALLDAGGSADAPEKPDQWSARVGALYYGKYACLDVLRRRTEPKTLMDASIDGDAARVRAFLAAGADPNAELSFRVTSLVAAARLGHLEVIELLLQSKADVDHDSVLGRPILGALERDHLDAADLLHRHGASLDRVLTQMSFLTCSAAAYAWVCERHAPEEPDALLARAAGYGDLHAMRAMLAMGANPDGREAWGRSALTLAVASNRVEAVRLLLEHGADPRGTDRHGRPLLHYVLTYDDVTDDWDDPSFDPADYERDSSALDRESVRIIRAAGARLPWER